MPSVGSFRIWTRDTDSVSGMDKFKSRKMSLHLLCISIPGTLIESLLDKRANFEMFFTEELYSTRRDSSASDGSVLSLLEI